MQTIDIVRMGVVLLAGYVLGSVPSGFLVVRVLTGRDITQIGSGRTGGTNAMRAGGKLAGALTGIGDMAKAALAVLIARWLMPGALGPWAEAVGGAAAVLGHNYSLFLHFRGGAGTGPNIGAAFMMWPLSALILIPAVPILVLGIGYASVASLTIAVMVPLIFWVRHATLGTPIAYVAYGLATLALVIWALRPNIRRLIEGNEHLVGWRARERKSDQRPNHGTGSA